MTRTTDWIIWCVSTLAACAVIGMSLPVETAAAHAARIIAACADASEKDLCYETVIPELMVNESLETIFDVVRRVRGADPSYQFCHVLAHKIGERAVLDNPDAWLALIPHNPADGLCSNGFIHGVIVGRFRDDVLDEETLKRTMPDFSRACEPQERWHPSRLDQAICYHGMGHLFMFITDADYRRSLDACAAVTESSGGNFVRVCQEGVFMQTYQPLEPDDYDLLELLPEKPTRENYRRICAAFASEEAGACLREAWPLYRNEILDGSGIVAFCSEQPLGQEDACFESVFSIIGRMSQRSDQSQQIIAACAGAPQERRGQCFGVVATAFLEEDRTAGREAVAVCASAGHEKHACLDYVMSRAQFVFGADMQGIATLCREFGEWRSRCLRATMGE